MRLRLIIAISLGLVCPSWAQSDAQAVETQVKAAFLYKFAGYVEWPQQSFDKPDSPFVIGVLDGDGFAQVLDQTVAGRNMNGRAIAVQRLKAGEAPKGVHILFIPGRHQESASLGEAVAATRGLPVLTVTDAQQGLTTGCMIGFVIDQNKVRFDIAPEAAESSRLKISARLMSVARKVLGKATAS